MVKILLKQYLSRAVLCIFVNIIVFELKKKI